MAKIFYFRLSALFVLPLAVSFGLLPLASIQAQKTNSGGDGGFQPVGAPKTSSGGGSRGSCTADQVPLQKETNSIVPLIPATEVELTAEAHPTVFVQVGESVTQKLEFSIWDENLNGLYQTTVSLPSKPGIVSFRQPTSAPPFVVGKRYKWSLALICDRKRRNRDVVLEGWMQRTQMGLPLVQRISTASPLQKAKLYAQNRIWYEAVLALAEQKKAHPEDPSISAAWQKLLQSVGLQDVAQYQLIDCCQPNK